MAIISTKSVTLFYPVYNEREAITPMTLKALEVMKTITEDFEILIIDDGSSDGSAEIADELAQRDPRIRVIHHEGNKGYGQALRTGFSSASKTIVAYTDCDEPVDLWELPQALANLRGHDMVIGYRVNRWDGWRRFIYSKIYNGMVRLLFGVKVHDINFSFKMMWRDDLSKFHLGAGSVFIDGELLAEAARYQLNICELPIVYQDRKVGYSKFNALKPAIDTFKEIIAYWHRRGVEAETDAAVVRERI
ncbi:MAG: glycosyltransferase family 2 protein [Anaerolineae bacterium]|nr:glycosyltransferase family 2 protein [Anaerolineae bacterium]